MTTGILTASASGNTINYTSTNAANIKVPSGNLYNNLTVSGSNTKTLVGNIVVQGDITISSTLSASTYTINLFGDWDNSGIFEPGTGIVKFNGSSADQSITNSASEETFYNLETNKSSGDLLVNDNVIVSNNLTMTNGNIITGTNIVTIGTSAINRGNITYSSGVVIGKLERWINSTTGYAFLVGTADNLHHIILIPNSISSNGSLIVEFTQEDPGDNGLNPLNDGGTNIYNTFNEGYWKVTPQNSLSITSYDIRCNGDGMTSFDLDGDTRLVSRASSLNDWSVQGSHGTFSGTLVRRDDVTSMPLEFALGDDTNCDPPVTSALTGNTSVCRNATGEIYYVTENGGNSYDWTITGGTKTSGGTTNSITVNWGSTGMLGEIEVVESDPGCGSGIPVSEDVYIHAIPTSVVTGSETVTENATGIEYSVTSNTGYEYDWTITGGTQASGAQSANITVDWGAEGSGNVSVIATNNGCSEDATAVDIDVTILGEILSIASGNWDDVNTWEGGIIPTSSYNAKVVNGHTVTLQQDEQANNLTVESGATIEQGTYYLDIYADYTIDGDHNISQTNRLRLYGVGTIIDGSGTITMSNLGYYVNISTGNKSIAADADITIDGDIYVTNNLIVTNNGSIALNDLVGAVNSKWINATNSSLSVENNLFTNGILDASQSGNTVTYAGSNAQTVKQPLNDEYYNLQITGSNTKTLANDIIVLNDITINSALSLSSYTVELQGDLTNTNQLTAGTGLIKINGTADQTFTSSSALTLYNLTLNKPSGDLYITNDVIVSNNLTFSGGLIYTGSNVITVGTSSSNIGSVTYSSGHVVGKYEKWINSTSVVFFYVGNADYFRHVLLNPNSIISNGSMIVEFVESDPGDNGLVPLDDDGTNIYNTFNEGYWTMTPQNSLAFSSYDIRVNANGFSSFTQDANTRVIVRSNSVNDWTAEGDHGSFSGTISRRDDVVTLPAELALGDDTNCEPPVTSSITGSNSVCTNATGEIYYVTNTPGNTYNWSITGGTQTSGTQTNSITVTWLSVGMAGDIEVVESKPGCGNGETVSLDVNINPLPTSSITGLESIAENSTGISYSVTENSGYTYTWDITAGTQASGGTTNDITVDWGAAGSGEVAVTASHACGSASEVTLDISVNSEIVSATTGDWTETATWVGGVVPSDADNVRIASGHTVTLTQDETVAALNIESGAILDNSALILTVEGNYTINGSNNSIPNNGLNLDGISTIITGSGTINTTTGDVNIRVRQGNKTIDADADFTVTGRLFIENNLVVTNNGSVVVASYLWGQNASSTWTNAANSTLEVQGTGIYTVMNNSILNATATDNTVIFSRSGNQNITVPSASKYFNISLTGSGSKTLDGDIIILGDVYITSTLASNDNDISIHGDWTNNGDFTYGTGLVSVIGTVDQTIASSTDETFYNLTVNKASGILYFTCDANVNSALTMNGGNIDVGSNTLTLGISTANIGVLSRSGTPVITGKFERWVNSTGTGYLFPVGIDSYNRYINLTFDNLNNGSVIAQFVEVDPGDNGLIPLDDDGVDIYNSFSEGYWSLTPSNSLSSTGYDLQINGHGMTSFDIETTTRLLVRANSGVDWTTEGTHVTAVSDLVKRNDLTTFGAEYAFGDITNCEPPVTSAITGEVSVCPNSAGSIYYVTETGGNTYDWTITGGSQTSGGSTNTITVTWGATGMTGSVAVVENLPGCGSGDEVATDIVINPLPTSAISGSSVVSENTTGVSYSITSNAGYTYDWTITGGTIASGSTTVNPTVDWGAEGAGNISVITTHTTCALSADEVDLDVTINGVLVTAQSGNWDEQSTWVGNIVPVSTDNVKIAAGHTVTLTQAETINNIEIENTATFDQDYPNAIDRILTVNGDYTNNGTHTGLYQDALQLHGVSSTIDGTGVINVGNIGWRIRVYTGNKTIAATANLIIDGDLYINGGLTVTNLGTLTLNDLTGAATATYTNGENSELKVSNTCMAASIFNASANGNTVNYNGAGAVNITTPTDEEYYNLIISGGNTKSLISDLTVLGDITISSILSATSYSMDIKGDWSNTGDYSGGTSTVSFTGTSDQTITNSLGEGFYNLTVNKSSGDLLLANDVTVEYTLTMSNGNILADDNTLTLGINTSNIGSLSRTSGVFVGEFERWINTTGAEYEFPIGTATYFREATIEFNQLDNGSLLAEFISDPPGNNGLIPLDDDGQDIHNAFTEGYWTLTPNNSLASSDFDLDLNASGVTSYDLVYATRLITRASSLVDWTADGTHEIADSINKIVKRNNITTLPGEYGLGDTTNCDAPNTSSITGLASVCRNQTGEIYYVTENGANTYDWTITGGSLTAGLNTHSITVNWGATGMLGEIEVIETNTCGSGNPVTKDISIHPLPTSAISGSSTVSEFAEAEIYSVTDVSGYSYDWTITGGTQAGGATSNEITVDWGAEGSGNVSVEATHLGCSEDADVVDLDVDIRGVIVSATGGNWNSSGTWVGGIIPTVNDNVRIEAGHFVSLTADHEANSLEIEPAGILDNGIFRLDVYGDYVINGTHYIGDNNYLLRLYGSGTSIDGDGTISMPIGRYIGIFSGNKNIESTADITIEGDIYIYDNLIVSNNGTITCDDLYGRLATSTWSNNANSTLNVGNSLLVTGKLIASADGNTINYSSAGAENVKTPFDDTYHNLTFSGIAGTKTLQNDIILNGSFSLACTLDANDFDIDVAGDWTNTGTYTPGTGEVTFNGTVDQTMTNTSGETFYDLTINKSSGDLIFDDDVNVTHILDMTLGDIDAGSNTITLGTSTVSTGLLGYTAGAIAGKLERWVASTGTEYLFPIGTSSYYRPISVDFTNLSTSGSLIAEFVETNPGNNGLSPLDDGGTNVYNSFNEGYWTLTTANSLASNDYDLEVIGNGMTSYDLNDETRLVTRANSGAAWTANGDHDDVGWTSNVVKRDNITLLSAEYALADTTNCAPPATSAISGNEVVCRNESGVIYNVTLNASNTYVWEITGGSVTSYPEDPDRNEAIITWGPNGGIGKVKVTETNTCGSGVPVELDVTINPLSSLVVSGSAVVDENTSGEQYEVTYYPDYSYTWAITGGTQASGTQTATITVDWGAAGTGNVRVTANACGQDVDPIDYPVALVIPGVLTSAQDGNWSDGNTWVGGVAPDTDEDAAIANGHFVYVDVNSTIVNLSIENGGTLVSNTGSSLTVTGNYTIYGIHTITDDDMLIFDNDGGEIDGFGGNISNSLLRILVANDVTAVSVKAGAMINIAGGMHIGTNSNLVNNGTINIVSNITGIDATSEFTNAASGVLNIKGSLLLSNGTLNASADDNIVNYQGSSPQAVIDPSSDEYYHLYISGSATSLLDDDIIVLGNLHTNNFNLVSYSVDVKGNWLNSGTLIPGTSTVTFDGIPEQEISGSFYNLVINKTAKGPNDVVLSEEVTIVDNGTLQITAGRLVLGAFDVVIENSANTAIDNGGSSDHYIEADGAGAVVWELGNNTTSHIFPIGDSGDKYSPVTFKLNGAATVDNIAVNVDPVEHYALINNGTNHINRYWTVTPTNESNLDYDITLQYDPDDFEGTTEWRMLPIKYHDLIWSHGDENAEPVGNTLTWSGLTELSEFSGGDYESLPIELLSLNAYVEDHDVIIKWVTASEYDNDYFIVQRSRDLYNIEEVTRVNGAGDSNTLLEYFAKDTRPLHGVSYYRIVNVDYDGVGTSSEWVIIENNRTLVNVDFKVYPNPADIDQDVFIEINGLIEGEEVMVVVRDLFGNQLYSRVVITNYKGGIIEAIDPYERLTAGMYLIIGSTENAIFSRKLIIK